MESAGVAPAALSFNSLINACVKGRDIQRAEHWLAAMKTCGIDPDAVSYSTIINAYTQAQNVEQAERLLEEMHKTVSLSSGHDSAFLFCFNSVIQAFSTGGDSKRASHWLSIALSARSFAVA